MRRKAEDASTLLQMIVVILMITLTILVVLAVSARMLPQSWSPGQRYVVLGLVILAVTLPLGMAIGLCLSARPLQELYQRPYWWTLIDHLMMILGTNHGFLLIDDGDLVVPPDGNPAKLVGRRTIQLRSSVATLWQGHRHRRVVGPSTFRSERFEAIRNIYPLWPKRRLVEYSTVLTQDQVPSRVELAVTYGLALPDEVVRGQRDLTQDEQTMLARMDLEASDIPRVTSSAVEHEVRRELARMDYYDAVRPEAFEELEHHMLAQANRRLNSMGIRVHNITVTNIAPTEEMMGAVSRREAETTLEVARAAARRDALRLLADGYNNARGILAEGYGDNLRQMADVAADLSDWLQDALTLQQGQSDDLRMEIMQRLVDAFANDPRSARWALSDNVVGKLDRNRPQVGQPPDQPAAPGTSSTRSQSKPQVLPSRGPDGR